MVSVARVYSVNKVKVGFTATDGSTPPALTVSAAGTVNSGGWTLPELGVWIYITPPADGILNMDFMASPPAPDTYVTLGFKPVYAGVAFPVPSWVKGVRVYASTNEVVEMLAEQLPPYDVAPIIEAQAAEPFVPWPFPWWTPKEVMRL